MTRPSDAAIALKPCPFCSGEAALHYVGNDRTASRKITVKCRVCRIQLTHAARTHDFAWLERHIEADWNRRTVDAEAKDVAGETDPIVRYNDDGSLDEVVGTGEFHLEQMDHNYWWMRLGPHSVWLSAKGKIKASIGLNEQRVASAPTAVEGQG